MTELNTIDVRDRVQWRTWLARTYQRPFVVWVHTAKRSETRARRLRESIRLLASGRRLGLK